MHKVYFAKDYEFSFQTFLIHEIMDKNNKRCYDIFNVSKELFQKEFTTRQPVKNIVKIIENAFHRQDVIITSVEVREEDASTVSVVVNYLYEKENDEEEGE